MIGIIKGKDVLILLIPVISTNLQFLFKRVQFPLKAAVMTINKDKKQTLKVASVH